MKKWKTEEERTKSPVTSCIFETIIIVQIHCVTRALVRFVLDCLLLTASAFLQILEAIGF